MKIKLFAKYISYLFIPPVMNFLIFITLLIEFHSSPKIYYGIIISFLFGLLIPVLTILEFRSRGILSDNDATIKEERQIPYLFAIGYSLLGLTFSSLMGLNESIIMMWMAYLLSSIIIININRFWKISAHTIGASMPLGALVLFSTINLIALFGTILLLVSISRLVLKVHTFAQVIAGSIVGFLVSFVLLNYCM